MHQELPAVASFNNHGFANIHKIINRYQTSQHNSKTAKVWLPKHIKESHDGHVFLSASYGVHGVIQRILSEITLKNTGFPGLQLITVWWEINKFIVT